MKRRLVISVLLAVLVVAAAVTFWRTAARRSASVAPSSTPVAVSHAFSNSVEFVKNRITGGVGVALTIDPNNSLPVVGAVAVGSPAEEAGLRIGDVVTTVGSLVTTGAPLKQVVETFRGFTGASVPITVLRGTNYLDFVIRRTSMNHLQQSKFISNPYE